MQIFIDDYNLVRIESSAYIYDVNLLGEKLNFVEIKGDFQYFKTKDVIPLHIADKIYINHKEYNLQIGLVTIKEDFNKRYQYDGVLGVIYTKKHTTFKVFSPVAKEMFVVIDDIKHQMEYENPIWKIKLEGDFLDKKYYYLVRINNTFERVIDPYAKAGTDQYSVVINVRNTNKQTSDFLPFKNHEEAIIYEAHIRDLTYNLTVLEKKNYLGLINPSKELKKPVLNYIKDLGMTHIQLLPIQDFYEVDINDKDKQYNWGYNPKQYFTLSSWYSSKPNDHYEKINEFKKVVDYAHSINLGVNIDVVYNHVYERGLFPYDKLVPGYFYRHDKNYQPTNSSFVGNDVETTNYMVRKLIIDSLVYLTKTFKIDGYRFDLMGLMDIETMLKIEKELKKINPRIMLYGEGWNMDNALEPSLRSNMNNNKLFKSYAHFNDQYRNIMRGEQYNKNERGYLSGNNKHIKRVPDLLKGSKNMFKTIKQTINYVECHDNHTLNDQMILAGVDKKDIKIYQDFANHVIAISKGIAFYHAGQELYREKDLINDSYNKPDSINSIKWKIPNSITKFKEIIKIRKQYLNKDNKIYNVKIDNNLIIINVDNKLNIYLKNDFTKNSINEKNELIFNSQAYNKPNGNYELLMPGVYIFRK